MPKAIPQATTQAYDWAHHLVEVQPTNVRYLAKEWLRGHEIGSSEEMIFVNLRGASGSEPQTMATAVRCAQKALSRARAWNRSSPPSYIQAYMID